jgi:tetratricopeptide (TPR) repeat protein
VNPRSRFKKKLSRSIVIAAEFGIAVSATCAVVACATLGKSIKNAARSTGLIDEPVLSRSLEAPADYIAAVKQIEAGKFEDGLAGLEAFLKREPVSAWTEAAWFNQGRGYEGLERWTDAIERYRAVSNDTVNRAPKLKANALYRLSFCFEALGRDPEAVAALKDASALSSSLEREVAEAELPARLAAAYARVANYTEADALYERAEIGIAKLRHDPSKKNVPEWLPRTLYYMGSTSLSHVNWDEFEIGLRPLKRSQSYLLQAAELNIEPWSERAAQELIGLYRELWNVIEQAPVPLVSDPLSTRRRIQERQWDLAALVQEHILALRAFRLPVEDANEASPTSPSAQSLLQTVAEIEKKIGQLYAQRPIGEGLTPESLARQRSVRGRVVAPDNSLERLYERSKKLPAKKGSTTAAEVAQGSHETQKINQSPESAAPTDPSVQALPVQMLPATHIPESEPAPIHQSAPLTTEDPNL